MEGTAQREELAELAAEYVDHRQNVERTMEQKENMQVLGKIIGSLKKKEREMVLRRYYYFQSSKEIAFHMGMTVNAVDSKLSRLRKQMKKEYQVLSGE